MEATLQRLLQSLESLTGTLIARLSNISNYPFLNGPQDRLYFLYLLSYIALGIGIYLTQRSKGEAGQESIIGFFVPKKIYLHKSAILDYKFYVINRVLMKFLFIGYFVSSFFVVGTILQGILTQVLGPVPTATFENHFDALNLIYAVALLLVLDFAAFLGHYLHHRWPLLWEFHAVHHSAKVLTPITTYRMHPMDNLVTLSLRSFLLGVVGGIFGYLFSGTLEQPEYLKLSVLNIGIVSFVFLISANLRHSHLWLSYGYVLNHIFISPAQHQIHHSCEDRHLDKNFGRILAIWDWMFGTLYVPRERETFRLGLKNHQGDEYDSLIGLYANPFKRAARILVGKTAAASQAPDRNASQSELPMQ